MLLSILPCLVRPTLSLFRHVGIIQNELDHFKIFFPLAPSAVSSRESTSRLSHNLKEVGIYCACPLSFYCRDREIWVCWSDHERSAPSIWWKSSTVRWVPTTFSTPGQKKSSCTFNSAYELVSRKTVHWLCKITNICCSGSEIMV